MLKNLARHVAGWVLPYRVYKRIRRSFEDRADASRARLEEQASAAHLALARSNSALRNRHPGQRCFVLCNGPSVTEQDLSKLEGEVVISVSNGYHHPLYGGFRPLYHCVPQITYTVLKESDVVRWFREMDAHLGSANLFLSSTEADLVRRHKLFEGREVRYVYFNGTFEERKDRALVDIANEIPRVQSVPIMCLMIAMYMGFREIYLLGTDHDHFITGLYKYFYEPTILKGKDSDVDEKGNVLTSRHDDFQGLALLWRQYRWLRECAKANGISIVNTTRGGALDEFPRAHFESLFPRLPSSRTGS